MFIRFCLAPVEWAAYRKHIQDAICGDHELLGVALLDDNHWFWPRTGDRKCTQQKTQNRFDDAHKMNVKRVRKQSNVALERLAHATRNKKLLTGESAPSACSVRCNIQRELNAGSLHLP